MKNIIIVIVVLVLVGGMVWFLPNLMSEKTVPPEEEAKEEITEELELTEETAKEEVIEEDELLEQETTEQEISSQKATIPSSSVTDDVTCDNYDCLIVAASRCQSISGTVSYFNIPAVLLPFPDFSVSGQTKYEIKKPSGINECMLIISPVMSSFSISEEGRKNLLAEGITNDQINTDLQAMNKSLELIAEEQTTCSSSAAIITSFLTDQKKLTTVTDPVKEMGFWGIAVKASLFSGQKTVTYTLSSGQKLECKVIVSRQAANTSTTISIEECTNQEGHATPVNDDGTACRESETDLGTIIGSGIKMNNKNPQCCVAKQ